MPYLTKEKWIKWRGTGGGVWNGLTSNIGKEKRKRKLVQMKRFDFIKWFNKQEKVCHYCKIELKDLPKMKVVKSLRFSIDRKDNDKPYELDNIVLACYRCNMIKGYTFTEDEMKEIADKYLINRL